MDTLQAHVTTMHELTRNTAGQSQHQSSHSHITANTMEHTNAKQTLIDSQDTDKHVQRTPLTRLDLAVNYSAAQIYPNQNICVIRVIIIIIIIYLPFKCYKN